MFENYYKTYNDFLSLTNLLVKPYCDSLAELRHSLERTEAFLDMLGAPQEKLKFVHVGGTSGKGSVSNYLHQILLKDGRKVGTYTSPHTTSYLERFRINNKLISPSKLAEYMRDVIKTYEAFLKKEKGTPSYFELSTCLALYAFEREGAEWCVLEVGCGGRYDATNVIPAPEVAIITNIDKDHTQLLGNSLSSIAKEKAGIIKRGSTILCGEQRPKLKEIFKKEAIKHNAALFFVSKSDVQYVPIDFGEHQQQNAMLAARGAQELGISDSIIESVLKNAKALPCRFELISEKPMIILDGAHSPVKIQACVERIQDLFGQAHVVFGCTASKDATKMMNTLLPAAKSIATTRFSTTHRKAANPYELLSSVPKKQQNGYYLNTVDALKAARVQCKKGDAIVVTGSLFLAGELREQWISESDILKSQTSFPI